MEHINIAELLRDCPAGMELDCAMFEGLEFIRIDDENIIRPIMCRIKLCGSYAFYNFTKYGCWSNTKYAKCVIFPKSKTTWEGFVPPCKFKAGDILYIDCADKESDGDVYKYIFILKEIDSLGNYFSYCHLSIDGFFSDSHYLADNRYTPRFATEEERQKLFDAIKDNSYEWDPNTKTLNEFKIKKGNLYVCIKKWYNEYDNEIFHKGDTYYSPKDGYLIPSNSNVPCKVEHYVDEYFRIHSLGQGLVPEAKALIKPKFKVGDRIKHKHNNNLGTIGCIDESFYHCAFSVIPICEQDSWEIVPNKFDITTLKPFDKVLVRDSNKDKWNIDFFSYYRDSGDYQCMTFVKNQCIPYEGNEHLLSTTNNCSEYYKNWK